jgi:hypothetical protein
MGVCVASIHITHMLILVSSCVYIYTHTDTLDPTDRASARLTHAPRGLVPHNPEPSTAQSRAPMIEPRVRSSRAPPPARDRARSFYKMTELPHAL